MRGRFYRSISVACHLRAGDLRCMPVGVCEASRNGEFAAPDAALERIRGRLPIAMRDRVSIAFGSVLSG